jgi:hypothetical protein
VVVIDIKTPALNHSLSLYGGGKGPSLVVA